jgi:hypothetical protein
MERSGNEQVGVHLALPRAGRLVLVLRPMLTYGFVKCVAILR